MAEEENEQRAIAARMKELEERTCTMACVPRNEFIVIRCDGHKFSTYTKGFQKPFDERLGRAMIATAADLLLTFAASTAFVESDEITLVLPALVQESASATTDGDPGSRQFEHSYGGRVQKLASSVAGCCSARFNFHINAEFVGGGLDDEDEEDGDEVAGARADNAAGARPAQRAPVDQTAALRRRVRLCAAYFDARVIAMPTPELVVEHMRWRSVFDSVRNSTSLLATKVFGHAATQGKSAHFMRQMLRQHKQNAVAASDSLGTDESALHRADAPWLLAASGCVSDPPPSVETSGGGGGGAAAAAGGGRTVLADASVRHVLRPMGAAGSVAWEAQCPYFRWGAYLKRQRCLLPATDRRTGKRVLAVRSRVTARSFPLRAGAAGADMLFARAWPDPPSAPAAAAPADASGAAASAAASV